MRNGRALPLFFFPLRFEAGVPYLFFLFFFFPQQGSGEAWCLELPLFFFYGT